MLGDNASTSLPLQLDRTKQGEAAVVGRVSGNLNDPQFRGQATVTNASIEGHAFDRFSSDVTASEHSVALQHLTLSRGPTEITGDAAVIAGNGTGNGAANSNFLDGPLTAQLSVKDLQLAPAAREFEIATVASVDADALASGTVHLSGTARRPEADIVFDATQAKAFGEQFERVHANLRYSAQSLAFTAAPAHLRSAKQLFPCSYPHH